ncbi:MAG: GDSL-type esterase/lipase family protein [Planctomycetaceae bacterium]|jgi:lysophospholipase L1-like esterase|nr:GDSL-type esterase/lipase family protein [Planctomycetaceae bacterium]
MQYILLLFVLLVCAVPCSADEPAAFTLSGDWTVKVQYAGRTVDVAVFPAVVEQITGERHSKMPLYDANATWNPAMAPEQIRGIDHFPTTFALETQSVKVRSGTGADAAEYVKDKDFQVKEMWGAIGRLPNGNIGENQPVFLDYRFGKMRLDSIVLTKDGKIEYRLGQQDVVVPVPPKIAGGEKRLGNIWVKARITKLEPNLLFPILETVYPETGTEKNAAETLLPKTTAKIRSGQPVKILAWGDSVTEGAYLPLQDRWQEQFVKRLRLKYPAVKFELITEGWGGRTTAAYRNEPPESIHNFQKKVLDVKPDVIISEFVNDAYLNGEALEKQYSKILEAFNGIGAEWVILTPHYVRTDWMGLDRERDIDNDPRPYTQDLRKFAAAHNIALADAAARYGRLWRRGIPYSTLMSNNINHPNAEGHQIFADALLALFP